MSATQVRPPQKVKIAGSPSHPQVNLLPPEIRAGRQLSSVKSWLGIGLLLTLLIAGVLVLMTEMSLRSAQDELAETQDENASLVAQQAEYAEVPAVLGRLDRATSARLVGMASEVVWQPYLRAIAATAPAGVSIDSLTVTSPTDQDLAASSGTADMVVAIVTFQAKSATHPDTATWLDGLASVRGLSDPWFSSASIASLNNVTYYAVTGTVYVTYEGLALRFVPVDEVDEADDADATTDTEED